MTSDAETIAAFYARCRQDGRAYVTQAVWIVCIKGEYYQCSAMRMQSVRATADIGSIRKAAPHRNVSPGGRGRRLPALICLQLYRDYRRGPGVSFKDLALRHGVGINTARAICLERHPVIRAYLRRTRGRPETPARTDQDAEQT